MKSLLISSILFATLSLGSSANIFAIFPMPAKSHYVMFERLLKRLAQKGHNVDVATHFPLEDVPLRYTQLSLAGSIPNRLNNFSLDLFENFSHFDWLNLMIRRGGVNCCDAVFKTRALQDLRKSQKNYDLVITELFGSDCMLGFGYFFNAPTVSLMSSIALPWAGHRLGNSDNPSYIPNYFLSSADRMTLYERIENVIYLVVSKFMYYFISMEDSNKICSEFFNEDMPSLNKLVQNTSLILVNSHFSFSYVRPTVPNFIEVGGLHINEPKPLSKYFEDLVWTDTNGIIYLSMGSLLTTESFHPEKLQGLFDAFAELPYQILWKATKERLPNGLKVPKNIHFEKWMPQTDVLCHPNVKMFVSHGGVMGVQEAIYCGVPSLAIPFFADQNHNIHASETQGIAIKVTYEDINKETILNAARKLLEDPIYKQNAEEASRRFKDRPMSPLDTAVYWVEYVIRHHGAPQLRSPGADLPWYQYFQVDVVIILLLSILVAIFSIILTLKFALQFANVSHKKKSD